MIGPGLASVALVATIVMLAVDYKKRTVVCQRCGTTYTGAHAAGLQWLFAHDCRPERSN